MLPGTRLIVVDNASSDGSVGIARHHANTVIENTRNLGFGTACNLGADAGSSELILFVNPDAGLGPDALDAMVKAADMWPDTGAFNPQFLGADETPFQRGPGVLPGCTAVPEAFSNDEISILSGAAVLCRRTAFEAIGGFDEQIFLFFEDDDLSIRLRAGGWALRQVGDAHVRHLVGRSSTSSFATRLLKERAFARSELYVAAKHGIRIDRRARALRALRRFVLAVAVFDSDRISRNLGRFRGYIDGPYGPQSTAS
ncbi:MAG: glycosyltransferase family 2 protein [Pseudomonadota bacterium]